MKLLRVFGLPLLGAIIIAVGCTTTEEIKQGVAAPPSEATAPTITQLTAPAPQPNPQVLHLQPKLDPVPELIKQVEDKYAKGEANYRAGHLEAAREDFDLAFDTLLNSRGRGSLR